MFMHIKLLDMTFSQKLLEDSPGLVPDAMSIGLDIVDMSETSKGSLEAKSEFGRNPMGICLSLIQVYISQAPLPHMCHLSLDWTIAATNKHSSYFLPHLCYSFSQSANATCSQNNTTPTQSITLYCSPLCHFFFMILTNPSHLCYNLSTLHHCPYLHSFRLFQ